MDRIKQTSKGVELPCVPNESQLNRSMGNVEEPMECSETDPRELVMIEGRCRDVDSPSETQL